MKMIIPIMGTNYQGGTIMNKKEIMKTIKSLARSQGFYGRLYETLKSNPEALEFLEKQNFKDSLEMVMFLEA